MTPVRLPAVMLIASVATASFVGAADGPPEVVRLKNGNALSGEIVQHDDRGTAIRLGNGREMKFATDEIASVQWRKTGAERAAERAWAEKNFPAAAEQYEAALSAETRDWAKARLRLQLTSAYRLAGRWDRAADQFLEIARERDDPEATAFAPLVWIVDAETPAGAKERARRLISDPGRPLARLIGASWLLGSEEREEALKTLRSLETDRDPRVSLAARGQAWRVRVGRADAEEMRRFKEQIEKLPPSLQAGPRYLHGLALAKAGSPGDAALEFLTTAYVVGREPDLIADSLLQAGRACQAAGFYDDARKILQEVVRDYPGTVWGSAAAAALAKANGGAAGAR